ncbi:hypothetical protein SAMN05519103_03948 [Rhizobiales bacterium GAS113]|nr:hypothetical protein SAMN05519103_03948 [Rhizobiales bacterium GAS113]
MPMLDAPASTDLKRLRDHDASVRSLLAAVRLDQVAPPRRPDAFKINLRSMDGIGRQLERI